MRDTACLIRASKHDKTLLHKREVMFGSIVRRIRLLHRRATVSISRFLVQSGDDPVIPRLTWLGHAIRSTETETSPQLSARLPRLQHVQALRASD